MEVNVSNAVTSAISRMLVLRRLKSVVIRVPDRKTGITSTPPLRYRPSSSS